MRGFTYTIFLSLILLSVTSNATLRYVSKTGSSTPPYTSWETASDSIRKCIDVSVAGDTIFVGPGTYSELFDMKPGIALIGAGMDSTLIDSREMNYGRYGFIEVQNGNIIEGFHIIKLRTQRGTLFEMQKCDSTTRIRFNKVTDADRFCTLYYSDAIITNNILDNVRIAFDVASFDHKGKPLITDNVINNSTQAFNMTTYSNPVIRNNIFLLDDEDDGISFVLWSNDSLEFANNLVIDKYQRGTVLTFTETNGWAVNNVIISNSTYFALSFKDHFQIFNNIIMDSEVGLMTTNPDSEQPEYNNIWNVELPDSGFTINNNNLFEDPMFINKEGMDFHLQKYSPLIDAGHPDILDKDGTRSDIGLYGGPYGEEYTYQDLAPRYPVNINVNIDEDYYTITWNQNNETDFSHYNMYASYTPGFTISANTFLTRCDTSLYIDNLPDESIYLKITSMDNQGNESLPGEEIEIKLTGLNEAQTNIADYRLYQNYPNPFNPSTVISYTLKEQGYVTLSVYDIKGEKIVTLAEGLQNAGYHELEFNGKQHPQDAGIVSGIYLYSLEVKSNKNIPAFRETKKMIMLK